MRLRALAPGKVNLALFLGGVRADGRHELVTLIESVSLADELSLEVIRAEGVGVGVTPAAAPADAVDCPGVAAPNLVAQLLSELRARGWDAPPVRISIRKRVPVAAGMGGGSADAAAALRLAARLAPLPPGAAALELASSLGADVPSQLEPGLVLGTGAGDVVTRVRALAPHAFVVVLLDAGLSTAAVYREADRLGLPRGEGDLAERLEEVRRALAQSGGELPAALLVNDLEPAALSLCPEISDALAALREAGVSRAFVSGSGPTVVGLYTGDGATERAAEVAAVLGERWWRATAVVPVDPGFGEPVVDSVRHNLRDIP
jgi:4-diphosphocytidyl-2-C-methyl-D-erythritol kinase